MNNLDNLFILRTALTNYYTLSPRLQ